MALKETNKNRKKVEVKDMGEGNINFPEWEKISDGCLSITSWVLIGLLGILVVGVFV